VVAPTISKYVGQIGPLNGGQVKPSLSRLIGKKWMTEFLLDTIHVPYDMMGAFRSAGIRLSWIESLFREQDLHMIFCSEWAAAALSYIGVFQTDNAARWNPNRLCRHLRRKELVFKPRRLK
jgi:hypothetical protein